MIENKEPQLYIPEKDLTRVLEILRKFVPSATVFAYGSRVSGDAHDASDLDLAIRSETGEPLPIGVMSEIRDAFSDSNIPIIVDIRDWYRIPESFREEIERLHSKIFPMTEEE